MSKISAALIERGTHTICVVAAAGRTLTHREVKLRFEGNYSPTFGDRPKWGVFELAWEQGSGRGVHAFGFATLGLGADGVEVHEPGLEQGLGDGFEGGVGLAQVVDA